MRPGATRGRPGGRRADGSRREALLQAAVREFLQRGYEGTSLLHIIQQVGGSRRAIYEEFGDKRGLFTAAVQEVCRGGASAADQARVFELPPEQALRIFGQRLLEVLISRETLALYRMVAGKRSLNELARELAGRVASVSLVGDALSPRDLQCAIREGHLAGRRIA